METALLILVLSAGDPSSKDAALAIGAALQAAHAEARIVLPPESARLLAERGLGDADLIGRSDKPVLLTGKTPKLVLVRVERRDAASDRVVAVDLWSGGRTDSATAVTGATGDPVPPAAEAVNRLFRDLSQDPAAAGDRLDRNLIAPFAERGDWMGLVAAVERAEKPSPRLRHAAIMAMLRLGDRDGAKAALAAFAAAAPEHPLLREATALVQAEPGDAMRDPVPSDDGGNVLR